MNVIYDETEIPHRNLMEINSTNKTNNTNLIEHLNSENLNKELLKKQMKYEKQKQTIKLLQQQIQSCNNTNEIENLKSSIYEEISSLNNQLTNLNEQNKYLMYENCQLKNTIMNKNKVIEEFEELARNSSEKFNKLERHNNELIKKLCKFQKDFIEIENKINEKDDSHKKLKEYNKELVSSISDIKTQIDTIENDYNNCLQEKMNQINYLSVQLSAIQNQNEELHRNLNNIQNKKKKL